MIDPTMIDLCEKVGIGTVAFVCLGTLIWAFKFQMRTIKPVMQSILEVMQQIKTWMEYHNGHKK